jgi:hypothetical protein
MGELKDRVSLSLLVNGNGAVDNFKNNSLYFYDKYGKSDKDVKNVNVSDMMLGGFYFLHYRDDSKWMQYAPIFVCDFKKVSNLIIIFAVNFNFIPLEIRVEIFDKYIKEEDFEKNSLLKVNYQGVYNELLRLGFEYALMEFNLIQVNFVHRISLDLLPRFLYSQHPINKYDPMKLMQIWTAKLDTKEQRHKELMAATLNEFYDLNSDISEKYDVLGGHIQRVKKSLEKYVKNK